MSKLFASKFPLIQSRSGLEFAASWLRRAGGDPPENIADHPKSLLLALLPVLIPVVSSPAHVWSSPDVEPDGMDWVDFAVGCAFAPGDIGIMRKRCKLAADVLGTIAGGGFVLGLEDARGYVHEFVGGPTQHAIEQFLRGRRVEEAMKALDPAADSDLLEVLQMALADARPVDNMPNIAHEQDFARARARA